MGGIRTTLGKACARQKFIATIDPRNSGVSIYSTQAYEKIERSLIDLPSTKKEARLFKRILIGYATELEADADGNVFLPQELIAAGRIADNAELIEISSTAWQLKGN